jgi:transposase InsO family protein
VLRRPIESTQYVSNRYAERLAEAGIKPSVGSVGNSYENALAETINGLYKAEVIHRRPLEPIGNIPPAEAEARYHAAPEQPALAA